MNQDDSKIDEGDPLDPSHQKAEINGTLLRTFTLYYLGLKENAKEKWMIGIF